jgi:hypothetical protein
MVTAFFVVGNIHAGVAPGCVGLLDGALDEWN